MVIPLGCVYVPIGGQSLLSLSTAVVDNRTEDTEEDSHHHQHEQADGHNGVHPEQRLVGLVRAKDLDDLRAHGGHPSPVLDGRGEVRGLAPYGEVVPVQLQSPDAADKGSIEGPIFADQGADVDVAGRDVERGLWAWGRVPGDVHAVHQDLCRLLCQLYRHEVKCTVAHRSSLLYGSYLATSKVVAKL